MPATVDDIVLLPDSGDPKVQCNSNFSAIKEILAALLSSVAALITTVTGLASSKQDAATAVTLTGAQILSNKTLNSPAISGTPTGLDKAHVGLPNVTNDAQLKAASNLSDLANAGAARDNLGLGSGISGTFTSVSSVTITNGIITEWLP